MNTVKILIKTVYGENKFYPYCEKSEVFARMSKTKTLDRAQLESIRFLGYEIEFYLLFNGEPIKANL